MKNLLDKVFKKEKTLKVETKKWDDISLRDFIKIKGFIDQDNEDAVFDILQIIYKDIDIESLNINDFSKFKNSLNFLTEDIKRTPIRKIYQLGKTKYKPQLDLTSLSVSQFIDYQNYCKQKSPKYEDLLSVFIMPDGHSYNDGYDIEKTKEDILDLKMTDVMTMIFFFEMQCKELQIILTSYLRDQLCQMKETLTPDQKAKMEEAIQIMDRIHCYSLGVQVI